MSWFTESLSVVLPAASGLGGVWLGQRGARRAAAEQHERVTAAAEVAAARARVVHLLQAASTFHTAAVRLYTVHLGSLTERDEQPEPLAREQMEAARTALEQARLAVEVQGPAWAEPPATVLVVHAEWVANSVMYLRVQWTGDDAQDAERLIREFQQALRRATDEVRAALGAGRSAADAERPPRRPLARWRGGRA